MRSSIAALLGAGLLVLPLSVADAKKCEKNVLEVRLHCGLEPEDRAGNLIVAHSIQYYWTDPDNGKSKDAYTPPETHQASVCMGVENGYLRIPIKDSACDGKDFRAGLRYCRLTKAEYDAAGKPSNLVELCKKLKKPELFITSYHFDANKDPKEIVNFTKTAALVEPIN